jgi:enamine deaminase RidA (YjgF/YER057c/UK114 family)
MTSKHARLLVLASLLALGGRGATGQPPKKPAHPTLVKERINPATLATPTGYSQLVTVRGGKTLYVSGQLAQDQKGELVGRGDLRVQAEQAFTNLRLALAAAGAGYDDVVKLTTYVVGYRPEMLETLQRVRASNLGPVAVPASTLVGVQALARPGYLIEIEAVAVVD